MTNFSVDLDAMNEVRRILLASDIEDPIVCLIETADSGNLANELNELLIAKRDEQSELPKNIIDKVENLNYVLGVGVYERKQCPPDALVIIEDVTFSFSMYVYQALSEYCLIFKGGNFFLKSVDDIASNLRSVKAFQKPFKPA